MEREDKISIQVREHGIVLVGGFFILGFSLFILVMGLCYPSGGGNRLVFALVLFLMMVCGVMVCITYFHRRLTVEEMNLCYVNAIGKRREFSLNDIGYCKLRIYGTKREAVVESLVLYDLLGDKLCKLEMNMPGAREFLQYLLDNQVKTQWPGTERQPRKVMEPMLMEKDICKEETGKFVEAFYEMISPVFTDWEKQHKRFDAQWEFGLAEYIQDDLLPEKDMWQWESSVSLKNGEELPEDYLCILEAYLMRGEEYVMNRKGHVVGFLSPCIWQSRSYQVGESRRIRRLDETYLRESIQTQLTVLAKELPRHSYHTEHLTLRHELKKAVGRSEASFLKSEKT